jgi:uncharacterized membrane-anchored protein
VKLRHLLWLFSVLVILQLMVVKYGRSFTFKTAPVDPYDAFRGRYVALRVEAQKAAIPEGMALFPGQKVYVRLDADDKGFGRITGVYLRRPRVSAYTAARVAFLGKHEVAVHLPIERYYMEENAAKRAEKVYRQAHAREDAYALVKVKDGTLLVVGLYIGDRKIEDILKEANR